MLMGNTQYGDMLMELMDEGSTAERAIEVADTCYAIVARNTRCDDCPHDFCEGCKGEVLPYETKSNDNFYETNEGASMDDTEAAKLVITELGKVAKGIGELATKAKEEYLTTREYLLKKPNIANELAVLRQKVERSFGKTEMALKLLEQKACEQADVNERIDYLEQKVRNGGTDTEPVETLKVDEEKTVFLTDYEKFGNENPFRNPLEYMDFKDIPVIHSQSRRLENVIAISQGEA